MGRYYHELEAGLLEPALSTAASGTCSLRRSARELQLTCLGGGRGDRVPARLRTCGQPMMTAMRAPESRHEQHDEIDRLFTQSAT